MAADIWNTIREAIATKAATVATLRGADTKTDSVGAAFPFLKVLLPSYELVGQTGSKEWYRLTIPAELLCSQPAGRQRSEPTASEVARDLQEAWWTGTALGLETSGVARSWIASMTHGLVEYADEAGDGYRVVFIVDVDETLSSART